MVGEEVAGAGPWEGSQASGTVGTLGTETFMPLALPRLGVGSALWASLSPLTDALPLVWGTECAPVPAKVLPRPMVPCPDSCTYVQCPMHTGQAEQLLHGQGTDGDTA